MTRITWGAVGLAITGASVILLARARSTEAGADAGRDLVRVERRDIGSVVKATGVIKPRVGAEVRVGSRISGVVQRLYVQIGDTVRKGQLLAQLDERDLVARRNEAQAALQQSEVTLAYAKSDAERKRALAAFGGLAPSDLDVAERAVAVAEKQVNGAHASLDFATTQLAYTRIVAPIAGVVASVSTQEGETVAASFAAPTFLTLLDPSRLEVRAYVDETDIGRIRMGQKAQFTVDTYGDHPFAGRITDVYPKAEIRDNVVNYVSVVTFTPPNDRVLRPEMTTTVRIELDARSGVLAVPIRAVRWEGGRAFVLAPRRTTTNGTGKNTENAVDRRWVTTGVRDERYVEIIDGLREGDQVLVGNVKREGGGPL